MRQPLFKRLRPFLRRDLRARLTTAVLTVLVLSGLSWLGISALTKIDSSEAHQLRIDLGLEDPADARCGGHGEPRCSYEDRFQADVDETFAKQRRLRIAVLTELSRRINFETEQLQQARTVVENTSVTPGGVLEGDTAAIRELLDNAAMDLRPAPVPSAESRRSRLLWPLDVVGGCDNWAGCGDVGEQWRSHAVAGADMRKALLEQIDSELSMLDDLQHSVLDVLAQREGDIVDATSPLTRSELIAELSPLLSLENTHETDADHLRLAAWLTAQPPRAAYEGWDLFDPDADRLLMGEAIHTASKRPAPQELSHAVVMAVREQHDELAELVIDPNAELWANAWSYDVTPDPIVKPTERYRSPIRATQQWRLIGTAMFLLAGIMLVVVGPIVTATSTAREREAGTLPVLRMTGLSAWDLALAMAIGPNVFALVAGSGLLLGALAILSLTTACCGLFTPLAVLLLLAAATNLTAIGLGDALGHRVNALIVGGLMAFALLGPGLIGATMVIGDVAATGFLLGPVPAVLATIAPLSGLAITEAAASGGSSEFGVELLYYALAVQVLLGGLSLASWRRRVEQAWAPLFRPLDGAVLALASVGCSALAVLDLSQRVNVQTYDDVNLITFVATGFLMPVLGWLLVSSLVRPARASAVASVREARLGFVRFQAFIVLTAAALAASYALVMQRTGLGSEESEVMWATICQCLLIAETVAATLLWAARRRDNRHRILTLGAIVVALQVVFTVGVYNLEVTHVALTQTPAHPFLLAMDASPYWLAFLVLLWAAGLGLVLAALLRERDRLSAEADESSEKDDEDNGERTRWLH